MAGTTRFGSCICILARASEESSDCNNRRHCCHNGTRHPSVSTWQVPVTSTEGGRSPPGASTTSLHPRSGLTRVTTTHTQTDVNHQISPQNVVEYPSIDQVLISIFNRYCYHWPISRSDDDSKVTFLIAHNGVLVSNRKNYYFTTIDDIIYTIVNYHFSMGTWVINIMALCPSVPPRVFRQNERDRETRLVFHSRRALKHNFTSCDDAFHRFK